MYLRLKKKLQKATQRKCTIAQRVYKQEQRYHPVTLQEKKQ